MCVFLSPQLSAPRRGAPQARTSAEWRRLVSWWGQLPGITQRDSTLRLQCNFFPSFWRVARIYTVPTVRPPDSGLPWRHRHTQKRVTAAPVLKKSPVEVSMKECAGIQRNHCLIDHERAVFWGVETGVTQCFSVRMDGAEAEVPCA